MTAQSSGTVTNGPGTGAPGGDKDPFCETFVTTLKQWCGWNPPSKRPSFNNLYYKNLAKDFPDIFKNMLREAPLLAWMKDGVLNIARASSIPAAAGALATLAGALLGAYNPANGPNWSGMRGGMHEAFQNAKNSLGNPRIWDAYPDGLSKDGKTWLEIKRPKDKVSDWQKKQHEAFEKKTGKPVTVAGCNCPGANCKDGDDCPEGYPPADPI